MGQGENKLAIKRGVGYWGLESGVGPSLLNKLHLHPLRDQVVLERAIQEQLDGRAAPGSVVHGPLVYVHADKGVGSLVSDAPIELFGVGQRRGPVFQAVHDARPEIAGYLLNHLAAEVPPNRVAAQRQRKAGLL